MIFLNKYTLYDLNLEKKNLIYWLTEMWNPIVHNKENIRPVEVNLK